MKTLAFLVLICITKLQAQKKNEIGFYFAPVKQSEYSLNNTNNTENEFTPFFSISMEAGIYFIQKINSNLSLQHNVHFGVLNHSTKSRIPTLNGAPRISISIDEAAYSVGYAPRIIYKPFKNLKQFQLIAGLGARYFFDVSAQNYSWRSMSNGALYEEILFANGNFNNVMPNEKKWQYHSEIGINYDIKLVKNKVLFKINPFYQHSFNTVYTGIYRYTKGGNSKNGSFQNKVHQSGIRFLVGYSF